MMRELSPLQPATAKHEGDRREHEQREALAGARVGTNSASATIGGFHGAPASCSQDCSMWPR